MIVSMHDQASGILMISNANEKGWGEAGNETRWSASDVIATLHVEFGMVHIKQWEFG